GPRFAWPRPTRSSSSDSRRSSGAPGGRRRSRRAIRRRTTFGRVEIIRSVRWSDDGNSVSIVDQRELPGRYVERELRTLDEVCGAIRTLAVRGAPAIGIAAAMGLVTSVRGDVNGDCRDFLRRVDESADIIRGTRP